MHLPYLVPNNTVSMFPHARNISLEMDKIKAIDVIQKVIKLDYNCHLTLHFLKINDNYLYCVCLPTQTQLKKIYIYI